MTTLITILISLLGYGTPADYADYSEAQVSAQIETAETSEYTVTYTDDGGGWDIWDEAGYESSGDPYMP